MAVSKRLSVLDYYFLLPYIGNESTPTERETDEERRGRLEEKRRDHLEMLQPKRRPIIDARNDYLSVKPDSSPRVQIAVFRGSGADLLSYSSPDFQSDYNWFALFALQNGKLRDVTKQILPVPVRPNSFLYELPRVGTTIHVFSFSFVTQTRKPAFDLLWRQGRFVVAKLKKVNGQNSAK